MTTLRSDLLVDARVTSVRELEIARKQGLVATLDLLALLTPDNFAELWPIIAPVINDAMELQQESGRRTMQGYMSVAALAAGFPLARMALPSITKQRTGLLPSGMPWQRLIAAQPMAVKHRIDNGMSAVEAVSRSQSQMRTILNSQAFSDFRDTAFDYVIEGPQPPVETQAQKMERLDREYQERVNEIRAKRVNENGVDTSAMTLRYYRMPEPGACSFCMMLATKGAVYFGADTPYQSVWGRQMGFRGARRFGGNRPEEWKAHNNCKCTMYPVFSNVAMHGITGVDETYFNNKNSVWRDAKTGREYDLRALIARKNQVKDHVSQRVFVNA